jgi:hypothetical protein
MLSTRPVITTSGQDEQPPALWDGQIFRDIYFGLLDEWVISRVFGYSYAPHTLCGIRKAI